jgi:hypothetical protein
MARKVYKFKKFKDFKDKLEEDEDMLLMSHDDFCNKNGKNVYNIPTCISPDGEEPIFDEFENEEV